MRPKMPKWVVTLLCLIYDHDFRVVEIWWGGHDYERIVRCRRCGERTADEASAPLSRDA
jgi:hypothetical protein